MLLLELAFVVLLDLNDEVVGRLASRMLKFEGA
jgi:hypothetical protein